MPNVGLDRYACDCGWLERVANDPSVPIGFDPQMNEYFLRAGTPGRIEAHYLIRFCPICGGEAPAPPRAALTQVIAREESVRLRDLFKGLRTREDVLQAWGPPDELIQEGYTETEWQRGSKPLRTVRFDVLRYKKLSPAAVVDVILGAGDRVTFTYTIKLEANGG